MGEWLQDPTDTKLNMLKSLLGNAAGLGYTFGYPPIL